MPVELVANGHQMMPLIVRHNAARGGMRGAGSITNKKAEGVTAAATIQIKLFPAVSETFGDQSGIGGLRATVDPGLQGKRGVAGGGKAHKDVGDAAIGSGERAKSCRFVGVHEVVARLAEQ